MAEELSPNLLSPLQTGETRGADSAEILSKMPPWLQPCCPNASPCQGSSGPDLELTGLCLTPVIAAGPQHAQVIPSSGTNNILHFSAPCRLGQDLINHTLQEGGKGTQS